MFRLPDYQECGYVGREFLLPDEKPTPPDKPAKFCIDCLLVHWRDRACRATNEGATHVQQINTFTVMTEYGEYGAHVLMNETDEAGRPTGIVGKVPFWSRNFRDVQTIPDEVARAFGLAEHQRYMIVEVNMDFQ